MMKLDPQDVLPSDHDRAILVGRAWVPGTVAGPSPVIVRAGLAHDVSRCFSTTAALLDAEDPVAAVHAALADPRTRTIGEVSAMLATAPTMARDAMTPAFLAPCDLQAVRASGVTFVASMLERVIEEHANGDPARADAIRVTLGSAIGASLSSVRPGSPEAQTVKALLVKQNLWSQYLEVGIGPDAEVFNKAQPMSVVGVGATVGILEASSWNNPEPEIVLAVNSRGRIVGAALGNDVNLRDWEGRSALLLGRAKDNNASCAIGPFIRLFDASYSLDDLRSAEIEISIQGNDGFAVTDRYSLRQISRDPADLAGQAMGPNHQYPDGLMLFLGTAFAPTQDRGGKGHGFTHSPGDVVRIRSPRLGALINQVDFCHRIAPWTFGVSALMRNLSERGLH